MPVWLRPDPARLGLVSILVLYGVLKAYGMNPAAGDENIYFYMATRTAEGLVPYRDYFFAHPPGHLLPGVLIALFTGFDLAAFKLVPILASAGAGYFVYRTGRRELGALEGVLAAALFLLGHDLLRASSHWTGANLGVLCLAAGLDQTLARRDRAAGALFAAGALCALYVAPVAMAISALRWVEDRRGGLTLVAVGLVVFAAVNLLFIVVGGGGYLDQVYAYHLRKPPAESAFADGFHSIVWHNPWLVWGAVVAVVAAWLEQAGWLAPLPGKKRPPRGRRRLRRAAAALLEVRARWSSSRYRTIGFAFVCVVVAALFLASLARVFHFYFLVAFPALALLGAYGYAALARAALAAGDPPEGFDPTAPALLVLFGIVVGLFGWSMSGAGFAPVTLAGTALAGAGIYLGRRAFPAGARRAPLYAAAALALVSSGALLARTYSLSTKSWYESQGGTERAYVWRDAPALPGLVNGAVRAVLWEDARTIGAFHAGTTHYLWHESRVFEGAQRMADEVQRLDPSGGTVFGDSTSAPLVALLAGRRLALDEADTNAMRFRSGMTPPDVMVRRLEAVPPAVIVARPGRGFFNVAELRAWVLREYVAASQVSDPYQGTYVLYVRRGA